MLFLNENTKPKLWYVFKVIRMHFNLNKVKDMHKVWNLMNHSNNEITITNFYKQI